MDDNSLDNLLMEVDFDNEQKTTLPEANQNNSVQITSKKIKSRNSFAIKVNTMQRGNPLLKYITNVVWEYDEDILADFEMGKSTCALFLSAKYHNLNNDYIHNRIKPLKNIYDLRVLLLLVDVDNAQVALKHLTRLCLLANLTLMLAWSSEEAAQIIETYKIFENKPPDLIMEKGESFPHQRLVQILTSVKSINKTDAINLISKFGTFKNIIEANVNEISECCGLGQKKANQLHQVLNMMFLKHK